MDKWFENKENKYRTTITIDASELYEKPKPSLFKKIRGYFRIIKIKVWAW